jgi:hypothetical protein
MLLCICHLLVTGSSSSTHSSAVDPSSSSSFVPGTCCVVFVFKLVCIRALHLCLILQMLILLL